MFNSQPVYIETRVIPLKEKGTERLFYLLESSATLAKTYAELWYQTG